VITAKAAPHPGANFSHVSLGNAQTPDEFGEFLRRFGNRDRSAWQMLGGGVEHYANCLESSNVLGQDVAPLRNTSVTGPDGPLPVSGMSSKTDTNPIVASAARPKKATALPYWSVV
jgi:hypothetical protein